MRILKLQGVIAVAGALVAIPGAVAAQTKAAGRFEAAVAQHEGYAYAAFRVETTGGTLTVNLTSATVDTYLVLRSPGGTIWGDDDGGIGNNSRIEVQGAAAGDWTVIATTYLLGKEGAFSISVTGASRITGVQPAALAADMVATAFALREADRQARLKAARPPKWALENKSQAQLKAEADRQALPELFPWPPPEPSSLVVLDRDDFVRPGRRMQTLEDIDVALRSALKDTGYPGGRYWGVRDGFALVTPIEQTDAEGTPLTSVARWSTQIAEMKNFTPAEYLRALLTAPAGYFRVIVFVITPHSFTSSAERANFSVVELWSRAPGHTSLPSGVRDLAFTADYQVTALVYEFLKTKSGDKPTTSIPGRHTANVHLDRTGILSKLR
jgi:hypothetical protein